MRLWSLLLVGGVVGISIERGLDRPDARPPEGRLESRDNTTTTNTTTITSSAVQRNGTLIIPQAPSTPPSSPPLPIPTPLDLSISYALSDSCLLYLGSLLSSTTFLSCLPFSLLLSTSSAYSDLVSDATTSGNYTTLNNLLSYTINPKPSSSQCVDYMDGAMNGIASKGNCAADLTAKKVVAREAWNGLGIYKMMKEASSLVDPDTGAYCYLEAVSSTAPDELYLWSVPMGIAVPKSAVPTCSKCSSRLLSLYASYTASNSTFNTTVVTQTISNVNAACGPSFISLNASSSSAGASLVEGISTSILAGAFGLTSLWFLL